MERFFEIKNIDLAAAVQEYEQLRKRINDLYSEFAEENGIESPEYYQRVDSLIIMPTKQDKKNFADQLKADGRSFKKASPLGKLWVKTCKEKGLVVSPTKPSWKLRDLISHYIYSFQSRLFSWNGKVYGSFQADADFELPIEHFREMKGSEFYALMEEITETLDK